MKNEWRDLQLSQQPSQNLFQEIFVFLYNLNPIHDEEEGRGGQKGPHTSFSPVTSTNVGTSPKTF